jgi:hypothetical protein
MNSKNKNIGDLYRGINGFKRGHQPSSNIVKDENGDVCGAVVATCIRNAPKRRIQNPRRVAAIAP